MEENWSKQADEIEALSAIFGGQLILDKHDDRKFSVSLAEGEGTRKNVLTLQVEFGPDYPSHAPPTYNIKNSSLRNNELERLSTSLDEIYLENMGESIVYQWVDKAKEFLYNKIQVLEPADQATPKDDDYYGVEAVGGEQEDVSEDSYTKSENYKQQHQEKSKATQKEGVSLPPIYHGEFVKDRKSTFQGHLAPVVDKRQVDLVMDKLKENKKIAAATHNIIAYRIELKNGGFITGCHDDGEIHASSRMLHLLDIVDARNVLVVVTRWYGGVHLGPDRFKHINNCTRDLLEKHGYISEKPNNKQGQKNHPNDSSNSKPYSKNKKH